MRATPFVSVLACLAGSATPAAGDNLPAKATRTERRTAAAGVRALSVSNINGDVQVAAGDSFAANTQITVHAETQKLADEVLAASKLVLEEQGGEATLAVDGPGEHWHRRDGAGPRDGGVPVHLPGRFRLEVRHDVTLPPGAALEVHTVNGNVSAKGLSGKLDLRSVNGRLDVSGTAAPKLRLDTVNGKVDAAISALPAGAELEARTVNGNVTLWLPAAAGFRFSGKSMHGEIVSTFPLPPQPQPARPGVAARGAADQDPTLQIAHQVAAAMDRSYEGSVKGGGASIRASTLNGRIAVLATGTSAEQAKSLLPTRDAGMGAFGWHGGHGERGDIVRGAVSGDFSAETFAGDVRLGKVSGAVKVITRAGDIRIAAAGKGADIATWGGDVRVDAVTGALKGKTLGGDVVVGAVSGDAAVETLGGDVRIGSCGGSVTAKTGGGDVTLQKVRGAVKAETAGGDIRVEVVGRETAAGVGLETGGGDVTLTLPANYRGDVEIRAGGGSADDRHIESDFAELVVSRKGSHQVASGKLGGGGARISVRTGSGTVRLKKGPAI